MHSKTELIMIATHYDPEDKENFNAYTSEQLQVFIAKHLHVGNNTLLPQLPVMLAKNVKHLSEDKFQKLLTNPNYIAQRKKNGCRVKLHFDSWGNIRVDTRHRSVKTFAYNEKTKNFKWLASQYVAYSLRNSILDCEMVAPARYIVESKKKPVNAATSILNLLPKQANKLQQEYGRVTFHAFDILHYQTIDQRTQAYRTRSAMLQHWFYQCQYAPHFKAWLKNIKVDSFQLVRHPNNYIENSFKDFFQKAMKQGWEGIILRELAGRYPTEPNCRTKVMYKWKKSQELDCFVIGSLPGDGDFDEMIGALKVACYNKKGAIIEVGSIQPGSIEMRNKCTTYQLGLYCLHPDTFRKVVTVQFQEWSKNGRMAHAVLLTWRPEMDAHECILEDQ